MTEGGATVLVLGAGKDHAEKVASLLERAFAVRNEFDARTHSTEAEVVVLVDGRTGKRSPDAVPEDAAQIAVFENVDDFVDDRPAPFDCVFIEPLDSHDLESAVKSLSRRVRYDRRLRDCAELAARRARAEPSFDDTTGEDPQELRVRIDEITSELDRLLAEFSSDDFRQAFRTIAPD